MLVTKRNIFTGAKHTMDLDVCQTQIDKWIGGMLIQQAMPQLSPDEREFMMTGCMPEEWDNMFGGVEDE